MYTTFPGWRMKRSCLHRIILLKRVGRLDSRAAAYLEDKADLVAAAEPDHVPLLVRESVPADQESECSVNAAAHLSRASSPATERCLSGPRESWPHVIAAKE